MKKMLSLFFAFILGGIVTFAAQPFTSQVNLGTLTWTSNVDQNSANKERAADVAYYFFQIGRDDLLEKDGTFGSLDDSAFKSLSINGQNAMAWYRTTESNPRVGFGTNGFYSAADANYWFSNSNSNASATLDTALARPGQAATVRVQGSSSSSAATFSTPALSPSQITADQNNYAPGTGWFQRWSSDASRNVTGLVAGVDGQIIEIWNVGSNNIVLVNASGSSTSANQFATSTGADITLVPSKCALGRYDTTSTKWRVYLCN